MRPFATAVGFRTELSPEEALARLRAAADPADPRRSFNGQVAEAGFDLAALARTVEAIGQGRRATGRGVARSSRGARRTAGPHCEIETRGGQDRGGGPHQLGAAARSDQS